MASAPLPSPDETPPAQSEPSGAPEKKRRKWAVDPGLASIIVALIPIVGALGGYIGHATAPSKSLSPAASASPSSAASVTIDAPVSGKVKQESTYTGSIINLHPGDSVWVFFQGFDKNGSIDPQTYPTSGPCVVDFSKNTWSCGEVFVGKSGVDSATYRVCPAVLNFTESHAVVELLEKAAVDAKGS